MTPAGQIVLFWVPHTDLEAGQLRPALLVGKVPGEYDAWLMGMISSQRRPYIPQFEEIIEDHDSDVAQSGLKVASVLRMGRLAVIAGRVLLGATGQISPERLQRMKTHLVEWSARS